MFPIALMQGYAAAIANSMLKWCYSYMLHKLPHDDRVQNYDNDQN